MDKKYLVTLTASERESLGRRIAAGCVPARDLIRARILLKADDGTDGPAWTDGAIATALEVSTSTIARVRKRFAEDGLEAAIRRRAPRHEYRRKLDGDQEAHLVALACTPRQAESNARTTSTSGVESAACSSGASRCEESATSPSPNGGRKLTGRTSSRTWPTSWRSTTP